MNGSRKARLADVAAMLKLMDPLDAHTTDPIERKRRLLADVCRLLGSAYGVPEQPAAGVALSPRLRQTLQCLLAGDSEKQIAAKLEVSRHTVHVYVKGLYRRFGASSRAELLSKWVRR